MDKMKYKILTDQGSEGFSMGDDEFTTVDEAVKEAQVNCYGSKFYIITIINWEAKIK